MNALLTGYREVTCKNPQCPRVRRGLAPQVLCKALPGSEMELKCPECKCRNVFRVPLAC